MKTGDRAIVNIKHEIGDIVNGFYVNEEMDRLNGVEFTIGVVEKDRFGTEYTPFNYWLWVEEFLDIKSGLTYLDNFKE